MSFTVITELMHEGGAREEDTQEACGNILQMNCGFNCHHFYFVAYIIWHWPCVTDNSGITTYGLMALGREMSTPPKLQQEYDTIYLFTIVIV